MRILLINPNSTESMTQKMHNSIKPIISNDVEVVPCTVTSSPASIEGYYDEAISTTGMLSEIKKAEENNFDGVVVACFDDPGINACRELFSGPVLGICEAGMKVCTVLSTSFSVVTTLPRSVPIIEDLCLRYGTRHLCRKVRSASIPVLALENEPDAKIKVRNEIAKAIHEDNCESVLLGCAGMSDLTKWLSDELNIPVIDGVTAAVAMIESLVRAGYKTSKIGAYAKPLKK